MKSGKLITLTLAGISLALTGCRRSLNPGPHETEILQPGELSSSQRSSLPTYYPDQGGALSDAPHNAYDPRLGYFHRPCNAWYPYPYDHYDSRWGYYRCGRWYPARGLQTGHAATSGLNARNPGLPLSPTSPDDPNRPSATPGAPTNKGIATADADAIRSSATSRGGFGSTGRRTSFFSGS